MCICAVQYQEIHDLKLSAYEENLKAWELYHMCQDKELTIQQAGKMIEQKQLEIDILQMAIDGKIRITIKQKAIN